MSGLVSLANCTCTLSDGKCIVDRPQQPPLPPVATTAGTIGTAVAREALGIGNATRAEIRANPPVFSQYASKGHAELPNRQEATSGIMGYSPRNALLVNLTERQRRPVPPPKPAKRLENAIARKLELPVQQALGEIPGQPVVQARPAQAVGERREQPVVQAPVPQMVMERPLQQIVGERPAPQLVQAPVPQMVMERPLQQALGEPRERRMSIVEAKGQQKELQGKEKELKTRLSLISKDAKQLEQQRRVSLERGDQLAIQEIDKRKSEDEQTMEQLKGEINNIRLQKIYIFNVLRRSSVKKTSKKRSVKASKKRSVKKVSKKRSVKKECVCAMKKSSKKRSVKKASKKRSIKASKKRSVKKASKKRSVKKECVCGTKKSSKKRLVKKSSKKRSVKKECVCGTKKSSKKRSVKKSSKKRSVKKSSKKRSVKKSSTACPYKRNPCKHQKLMKLSCYEDRSKSSLILLARKKGKSVHGSMSKRAVIEALRS